MSMTREQWKQRLIDAELPEDVVESFMADLKDEDLARLKEDMSAEDIVNVLKDAVSDETTEEESPPEETDEAGDEDAETLAQVFKDMEDRIVERITKQLEALEIEVAVPQLQDVIAEVKGVKENYDAISTRLKEMQDAWNEILKGDTQRLKEMVESLSPAQRIRLRTTLTDDVAAKRIDQFKEGQDTLVRRETEAQKTDIFHAQIATGSKPVIRDAQGNEYESLADFATGAARQA